MAIYGADPEQLAQLGRTLTQQIDVVTQTMSTVDSTLAAKLNAALAGYPVDVDDPRLSDTERAILRRVSE